MAGRPIEAMALIAGRVFDDLGYRRYEWKCDDRNEPSKRAALRLGFTFEGVAYSVLNFASLGFNDQITLKGVAHTAWTAGMVEFA